MLMARPRLRPARSGRKPRVGSAQCVLHPATERPQKRNANDDHQCQHQSAFFTELAADNTAVAGRLQLQGAPPSGRWSDARCREKVCQQLDGCWSGQNGSLVLHWYRAEGRALKRTCSGTPERAEKFSFPLRGWNERHYNQPGEVAHFN